jgi:hypothetical protein
MTEEKKEGTKNTGKAKDPIEAEFEALPLDEKFARLFRMEAVTLGETVNYVVNSSMKAVEKFGDVLTDLGSKIENEAKNATRRDDCPPKGATPKSKATKPKGGSKKPSAKPPEPTI